MSHDRAFAAKIAKIASRPRADANATGGTGNHEVARQHFAVCLSDGIDAALIESAGVEPRFAMLAPVLRREMTAMIDQLARQTATTDNQAFRQWATQLIDDALAAGRDSRRDPGLDAYIVDPYVTWRRRLKRAQWVLGIIALIAFLAYLASAR